MSRLRARHRWIMAGPWPNPKTGILYYRKATPPDIFAARDRLAEFGIKVTREVQRSLETKDRKPAQRRYLEIASKIETEWERWRTLLRDGPKELSHKNIVALAGVDAAEYLQNYGDNPQMAPVPSKLLAATLANVHAHYVRRSLREGQAVFELGNELQGLSITELLGRIAELLAAEPQGPRRVLVEAVASMLVDYRTVFGWQRASRLTEERRLTVTKSSRKALGTAIADFRRKAWASLERYVEGDYREPSWVSGLPTFKLSDKSSSALAGTSGGLPLDFLLDHKAKTTSIRAKTVSDNRAYLKKFAEFLGHDDARKVTKDDVRRWRDKLIEETGLTSKTITDKYLSAVRSALAHGVREFDLPFNAASGIADNRPRKDPERSKGWTEQEAVQILKATFGGSSKALSEPHKRAVFWMPWILAYTGLRAVEVAQFQGRHLLEKDGIPYLLISPLDGSTKSGKAWAVGVHRHLIELGLLNFIREVGQGPLFYAAYPDGTDLRAIKKKHRATDAATRVANWITEELAMEAPLGHPLHAFRHLFTTRSRGKMDKEARDFMLGSRSSTDAREGYGEWPPSVLDSEINKLPRFDVKKTGWRP
ncbi:MAG: site-specific integrase [Rhizobiaceae bacterium]|nr:site-specific integrase [Rhizobiaceae bacterium]